MSSPAPKPRPSRIDLLQTGTFRLRRRLQDQRPWQRALETPSLWVTLFLIIGTWTLMPGAFLFSPRATPGAIAARDYVASRDLLVWDEEATRTKQQQAREAVLPVYDLDLGALDDLDGRIEQIFVRGRRLLARSAQTGEGSAESPAPAPSLAAQDLLREIRPEQLRLSDGQAELLVRKRFSAQLEERLRSLATRALRRGVVSNKALLLENRMRGIVLRRLESGAQGTEEVHFDLFDHLSYPGEAREFLDSEIGDWSGYTSRERSLLADLLFDNLAINLLPNRSETLDRSEAAAAGAGRVFNQIRKGQVIVRKGDVVDAGDARVIAQMRGERQLRMQVPPLAGTFFLLALATAVVWLALSREKVADHSPRRVFGESLLLLLGSLLGAKFCFLVAGALSGAFDAEPLNSARSYAYAVPFASLALLAALLLGRHAALVLSILVSILASRLAVDGDGQWVIFYGFAGSLAAIYALDRFQFRQRLVMVRVGLVVGVINVLMVLILTALGSAERGWMHIGFDLLCAFVGGLLVTAVASFAVPILESLLAITTDIKLVELANTNLPLLRRLAFEAPGTFQHSLMVANLAKEGCEAIGADPVLAYSAGLYHDVGKVLRPEYFVENQRGGQNRHDKLLPSMSALILLNHVKDGLELAREHGLPQVIQDAISQHHGTRLIKYFYHRAMEQKDPEALEVTEDKYRYPGPKPQNKVMGVLMLADAVEAASRTLAEPAPAKIRGLIQTILEDILKDGQLEHTDLTLSDLRTVSDTFLRVLANIFHQRIDYPGFDFNAGSRRADKRAPAGDTVGEAGAAARAS
ncbi:MAG TPA: HDIG domain-containing protein [Thermoanaerobaculia bacterium]|jgi:putative nucleotidyltransferase with HDIG domain|nr:HDIG domain-containing protein [Thermoanaerobaculia bacterium]